MDYGTLINTLYKIHEIDDAGEKESADACILLDALTVSWLQEGRDLPKNQNDIDCLMVKAIGLIYKYN